MRDSLAAGATTSAALLLLICTEFDGSILYRHQHVTHVEPNAHSAFWLTAYITQAHQMLFDANARAAAADGVPRSGMCNTKPPVL